MSSLEWNRNSKGNLVARRDIENNELFIAFIAFHEEQPCPNLTIDIKRAGTSLYKKEFKQHSEAGAKESAELLYTAFSIFFAEKTKENSNGIYLENPEIVRAVQKELASKNG